MIVFLDSWGKTIHAMTKKRGAAGRIYVEKVLYAKYVSGCLIRLLIRELLLISQS